MPQQGNISSYEKLKNVWIKQEKYKLAIGSLEKFGAFSISAAVRGPYNKYNNPWYRCSPNDRYSGVC